MQNPIRTIVHEQEPRDEKLEVELNVGANKQVALLALELWAPEAKVSLENGVLCARRKRTDDGRVLKWGVFEGDSARLAALLRSIDLIESVVPDGSGQALVRFKRVPSERLQEYLRTMTGVTAVSPGSLQDKQALVLRAPSLEFSKFEEQLREHLRFGF